MLRSVKHFKGLDSLRFFAAYLVLMHHAEQIRMSYGLFNLKNYSLFNNGGFAVTFFFVLSGFLISYLLLKEHNNKQDVLVKKFYYRRILRIWPLYFLLVIIGALLLPYVLSMLDYNYIMPYNFNDVVWYFIFFSPFMVNIFYGHHLIEPLWSIGVEELFYIVWAPLFKFIRKYILLVIFLVILIRIVFMYMSYLGYFGSIADRLITMLRFEAMAIGGLGAYIVFNYRNFLSNWLFSKFSQYILVAILLLRISCFNYLSNNSIFFDFLFTTPILSSLLFMFIIIWFIINVSLNPNSIISLDNKILNLFGSISYGIYMYHMLIIFAIIVFLKSYLLTLNALTSSIVFYVVLTFFVILISYLSKKFFEDYFLSFKQRFRVVN